MQYRTLGRTGVQVSTLVLGAMNFGSLGRTTQDEVTAMVGAALASWINLFVDFLVTKHGLAGALQSDKAAFESLHAYFLDRLVPVCAQLLDAAAEAGEILPGMDAYELMLGVGNLCIGADNNPRYDARRMVGLVIAGLRLP